MAKVEIYTWRGCSLDALLSQPEPRSLPIEDIHAA